MGIFNELIPSQKSAILTFIEQQKTLAEVADELDRELQISSFVPKTLPLQSVYEISRKKSWMEAISQFKKETEEEMSKFNEVNEKIELLHGMVEKVDEINYFTDVPHERKKEVEKKNAESALAVKRVHQLESGDSNLMQKMPKKSIIKSLEPPKKFKSKFTTSSVTTLNPIRARASVTSFSAKASTSLASLPPKIHRNPPRVTVSESVRKLLDEVKEKRDSKNSQKQASVINVINLRLN